MDAPTGIHKTLLLKGGNAEKRIEGAALRLGLELTLKGTLKALPANTHWHFKKPQNKGTLEITLIQHNSEMILECKKNRFGIWVNEILPLLLKEIEV